MSGRAFGPESVILQDDIRQVLAAKACAWTSVLAVATFTVRLATQVRVEATIEAEDERAAAEQVGSSLPYLAADIARAVSLGVAEVDDWKVGRLRRTD